MVPLLNGKNIQPGAASSVRACAGTSGVPDAGCARPGSRVAGMSAILALYVEGVRPRARHVATDHNACKERVDFMEVPQLC